MFAPAPFPRRSTSIRFAQRQNKAAFQVLSVQARQAALPCLCHINRLSAFPKIAADGTAGYRHLARMREAAEFAQSDAKAAIAAYDQIAADRAVGPVLQDLAALRAAALLIDTGALEEAQRRLEPLAANDRTFRHTAREFLVLAAWRAGDTAAAKRWFDLITTDAQTPAATRSRVEMLMALGAGASRG